MTAVWCESLGLIDALHDEYRSDTSESLLFLKDKISPGYEHANIRYMSDYKSEVLIEKKKRTEIPYKFYSDANLDNEGHRMKLSR